MIGLVRLLCAVSGFKLQFNQAEIRRTPCPATGAWRRRAIWS